MAITDSVKLYHNPAFAGQVADMEVCNKISKTNNSGASIAYGLGVVRDGENGFKLPETGFKESDFLGVPERAYQDVTLDGEEFGTANNSTASVVTMGAVWVLTAEDVTAGGAVTLNEGGKFGTSTGTALSNAVWRTTATQGNLACVSFKIGG